MGVGDGEWKRRRRRRRRRRRGKGALELLWKCDSGIDDFGGLAWVAFRARDLPDRSRKLVAATGLEMLPHAGHVLAATSAGGEIMTINAWEGGGIASRFTPSPAQS